MVHGVVRTMCQCVLRGDTDLCEEVTQKILRLMTEHVTNSMANNEEAPEQFRIKTLVDLKTLYVALRIRSIDGVFDEAQYSNFFSQKTLYAVSPDTHSDVANIKKKHRQKCGNDRRHQSHAKV